MAALDADIEKLLPAALYKKGFDLCAAFSTKAYNDTTSNKKLQEACRSDTAPHAKVLGGLSRLQLQTQNH